MSLSMLDNLVVTADNALKTLFGGYQITSRENPATALDEPKLSDTESKHAAALMRINHCGEVCAQALYQGQGMTAKLPAIRKKMEQAAAEENDHLQWCATRLKELDSHTSILNPLWYVGSFSMGAIAGLIGDQWSLGFVAETEHQVVRHLQSHLQQLPAGDSKSRAIVEQMEKDELHHATLAIEAGGAELPYPIKQGMKAMAKVMTRSVYWV